MKEITHLTNLPTPCYYYNIELLQKTLEKVKAEVAKYPLFHVHYAVKANANPVLLKLISAAGLGADCVSGNEVGRAVECGFAPDQIVYAGVGKNDEEIRVALNADIFCFNSESLPEIRVIDEIAAACGKKARIALRVNPNVDAHTHHYITTGIEENKFGIYLYDLEHVIEESRKLPNVELIGLHFHIGSQITDMGVFRSLCLKVNEIQQKLKRKGIVFPHINFGGGLGIDYNHPYGEPIADFENYFATFAKFFEAEPYQQVHFELGRSIIAHCGDMISKVLYVKEGRNKKFVILDAGMNDLLRPALYQAFHKIENISSDKPEEKYDVVGPICESADCFGKDVSLKGTARGDLIVIHSAGAYGEAMASQYNLRDLPATFFSVPQH
ncbi:diaminopimelate decarboxylase [Odoribacter laneus]|jgi:diaminopimelate decarboxylase|uniref:diaminopimelate decarboxylase n=1 Tax=Odoribacter laneus TaxID=626933 RepID=UPI000335B1BC|nr:diaminopimelate decarboxylase [Odoribacter laneus]GKI21618.1 diaminopimelate decarboxylase [Odoribacter laneus]GKI26200.1 diaminopimelate decarboxylase [Odoribacter laneus]CCZ81166.1 diaminopimelate decarboxylase [Odoribacter laneus CAG:561]